MVLFPILLTILMICDYNETIIFIERTCVYGKKK